MTTHSSALALLAALTIGGCSGSASARPEDPPASFEHDMMVRFHMHASFDTVRGIERLLIHGKLDDARRFATTLAIEADAPGLESWGPQIALVRERAAALAAAPGIEEGCRREAKLAAACAQCHVNAGAEPEFRSPPPLPPDLPTVVARMARHQWAADRLWEGMIGASDEPWLAGLDVLSSAPLAASEIGADRVVLARRFQQLAEEARHAATHDVAERARVYGTILVACAGCHMASPTVAAAK